MQEEIILRDACRDRIKTLRREATQLCIELELALQEEDPGRLTAIIGRLDGAIEQLRYAGKEWAVYLCLPTR